LNALLSKYAEEVEHILGQYPPGCARSAVLPLLFLAQRKEGFISRQMVEDVAEISGVSATEVKSVVGFYTLFHVQPGGRYRIQVCTDLPCALRGADEFLKMLCDELHVEVGQTTPDGLFTIEEVKCLAACHRAPMFQVQGDGEISYHEHQTAETARAWIAEIRRMTAGQTTKSEDVV
jgi:NADH-quinone oxidoreductase subunit E